SPSVPPSKLEQSPEPGGRDGSDKRNGGDGAAALGAPKGRGGEMEPGKTERKEVEASGVQSPAAPKQADLTREGKAEEPKAAEAVSGNDITAPPNKELPPSPEKKSKAAAPSCTPKAAVKAKPSATSSPKRPSSAPLGTNKKATSPSAGPAAGSTSKRPGTSSRPSSLTAKDTKPKV
ncbi:MAP4 protein, partial [Erithacus rubecula]|nr:MAP4 protein [Erithacus rubecula]